MVVNKSLQKQVASYRYLSHVTMKIAQISHALLYLIHKKGFFVYKHLFLVSFDLFSVCLQALAYSLLLLFAHPRPEARTMSLVETVCYDLSLKILKSFDVFRFLLMLSITVHYKFKLDFTDRSVKYC